MKVGDIVQFRKVPRHPRHGALCLIVNIVTRDSEAPAAKNYVVLTTRGDEYRCWKGDLEVISAT